MKNGRKKLKITIFHCGFVYSGGGERIVLEQAKALRKKGYPVEIFAPTLDEKLCYPQEVKKLKVKTFFPELPRFVPGRQALWMILTSAAAPLLALRFLKTDIFIGENQPGAWLAFCIAKILRKPYFVYMNQPNRLLYPRKIDEMARWQNLKEYYFLDNLIKKLRFFVFWADRISFTSGKRIFVNGSYIQKMVEKIYRQKTIPCPAGAFINPFRKLMLNPHTVYKGELQIKNTKNKAIKITRPYILLTNRHVPQKKFEDGLKAYKEVLDKFPNLNLVITGPFTPYTEKLIQLSQKLRLANKIVFTEQVDEEILQKLYQNAALYIYTSPEEDFGMGIIEAMGWGVPVVAWKHAGPTVTVVDGKTGYLAKPYDLSDFAQKITSALKDPLKRSRMGKNAWEHAKNNFSWDRHVGLLEKEILRATHYKT